MNGFSFFHGAADFLRGNELSSGFVGVPNQGEPPMDPQTSSVARGKRDEGEAISPEREKQLETWMEQVKAFIRNIDVDSL